MFAWERFKSVSFFMNRRQCFLNLNLLKRNRSISIQVRVLIYWFLLHVPVVYIFKARTNYVFAWTKKNESDQL